MLRVLIAFYFFLVITPLSAQMEVWEFSPSPIADTIPPEIHSFLKYKLTNTSQEVLRGHQGLFIKKAYKNHFAQIVKLFNNGYFMIESELTDYLRLITNKILVANPKIPVDVRVYGFRSDAPNAVSYGNGVVSIMLGLVERFESEDQVAFVICHELAHYYLKHTESSIEEYAALASGKDFKKKMAKADRSLYGRYSRLKELLLDVDLTLKKHSRLHEFEADSLALQFFLRANYEPKEALRALQTLDAADEAFYKDTINFKSHFNFDEYPFKDSWTKYKRSTTWHKQIDDTDTAKTHPSCAKRILAVSRQLQTQFDTDESTQSLDFKYNTLAAFELIESDFYYKNYGLALFRSLQLIERFPTSAYLHAMIGKCLYKLYEYQKAHQLGKVLEQPDPRFDESYDRFLTFIHSLRLTELASLSYYYLAGQPEIYYKDEEFLYAMWLISHLEMSQIDPLEIKRAYIEAFPKGKYHSVIRLNKI